MGFLFFTLLLLPAILIYGLGLMLIDWVRLNPGTVNAVVIGILVLNLLVIAVLARARKKQGHAAPPQGGCVQRVSAWSRFKPLILRLWPVCAGFWAVLCVLYLVIQPIRFIPKDWGPLPDMEDCYGAWEITGYRGTVSRSEEEIEQYIGVRIVYEPDRFLVDGQTYPVVCDDLYESVGYKAYRSDIIWREDKISVPGAAVTRRFDSLDIETRRVRQIKAWLQDDPGEIVLGQLFYILDRDTILVYYGGVFYQAERIVQNPPENGG